MLSSIQLLKTHTEPLEDEGRAGRGDAHPLSVYQVDDSGKYGWYTPVILALGGSGQRIANPRLASPPEWHCLKNQPVGVRCGGTCLSLGRQKQVDL